MKELLRAHLKLIQSDPRKYSNEFFTAEWFDKIIEVSIATNDYDWSFQALVFKEAFEAGVPGVKEAITSASVRRMVDEMTKDNWGSTRPAKLHWALDAVKHAVQINPGAVITDEIMRSLVDLLLIDYGDVRENRYFDYRDLPDLIKLVEKALGNLRAAARKSGSKKAPAGFSQKTLDFLEEKIADKKENIDRRTLYSIQSCIFVTIQPEKKTKKMLEKARFLRFICLSSTYAKIYARRTPRNLRPWRRGHHCFYRDDVRALVLTF